jgi:hypothetical protein
MNRPGKMILGKLAFFADIYQRELFAAIELAFDVVDGGLSNS